MELTIMSNWKLVLLTLVLVVAATTLWASSEHAPSNKNITSAHNAVSAASSSSVENRLVLPGISDLNEMDQRIQEPYQKARSLIRTGGSLNEAETILQEALAQFPESWNLNGEMAEIYWIRYKDRNGGHSALAAASTYARRGFESGLRFSKVVNYRLLSIASEASARLGDRQTLDTLYQEALLVEPTFVVYLDYAGGLSILGDPRAEEYFKVALDMTTQQKMAMAAIEPYGEWLLDHERYEDVLNLRATGEYEAGIEYLHFLKGYALERLGRTDEARAEYAKYRGFNIVSPAPARFKIEGSPAQQKAQLQFEESPPEHNRSSKASIFPSQAFKGLSFLIYKEAGAESAGGKRAVAWVVRNRVLRGSVFPLGGGLACPSVDTSGATFPDQYKSVMCQGNGAQFNGVCDAWCADPETGTCEDRQETLAIAKDVYYGYAPDPVGKHCPGGFQTPGDLCDPVTKCNGGIKDTYRIRGGLFFQSPPAPCYSHDCAPQAWGAVCGNEGSENCFFSNPAYVQGSQLPVTGSITGTSCWLSSVAGVTSPAGIHQAHLEGTEDASNPDFKLEFQRLISGSWSTLVTSNRKGTVEDLAFNASAGTYRWQVCPVSGTGAFALYIKRP